MLPGSKSTEFHIVDNSLSLTAKCKTMYATSSADTRVLNSESIQANLLEPVEMNSVCYLIISGKNRCQTCHESLQRIVCETPEGCLLHLLHKINFVFGKERSVPFL